MKILLINPPHPAIGSRIPREHLPPLGLLAVGGPLLDAGHAVKLLDAEFGPMTVHDIALEAREYAPDAVLLGHSGSTSGHPSVVRVARAVRAALPHAWIVYGGVFPTYHWREVTEAEPGIDFIVRGEGEETVVRLIVALEKEEPLKSVPGIAFRPGTVPSRKRPLSADTLQPEVAVATGPTSRARSTPCTRAGCRWSGGRTGSFGGSRRATRPGPEAVGPISRAQRGRGPLRSWTGALGYQGWRLDGPRPARHRPDGHRQDRGVRVTHFE